MELGFDKRQLNKYKPVLVPGGVIVAVILLSLFLLQFYWGRIGEVRNKINTESRQRDVLRERLATLQAVQVEVEESSDRVALALPQSNPSVLILNHINNLSFEYNILVDNLSVNSSVKREVISGIKNINIDFDGTGNYTDLAGFIVDLTKISPLVNLTSLDVSRQRDGTLTASISLYGFYSEFPQTLPAITSPLEGFDDGELSTLNFLEQFRAPSFTFTTGSTTEVGKPNPFSF